MVDFAKNRSSVVEYDICHGVPIFGSFPPDTLKHGAHMAAELINPVSLRKCIENFSSSSLYFHPQKWLTGEVWDLPVLGGPNPLAYLNREFSISGKQREAGLDRGAGAGSRVKIFC